MNNRFNFRDYFSGRAFGALILSCWVLGVVIGVLGGDTFYQIIIAILSLKFAKVIVLMRILYAVVESLGSIAFFIILRKRLILGSIRLLVTKQITLKDNAHYLPSVFSLGVLVGLAGHPLLILLESIFR